MKKQIISIHWGFIPGGVTVYARHIEQVNFTGSFGIKSICINSPTWPFDRENAAHMDMNLINVKGRWDFSWIGKARDFIRYESPDLIMTHGFNGAFVAAIASKGLGIPIISSWHGDYSPSNVIQKIRKPFFDLLLKILFRYVVKEVITVSEFSKNVLLGKKISKERITVVHNGIPLTPSAPDDIHPIRKKLGIPNGHILVGTACRMVAGKRLDSFLKAIAIVTKVIENVQFIIWGDGPQHDYLNDLVKKLCIGKYIMMPGYRSDVACCLSALDIFVMCSYQENFSIALLEAMRAGLPIVTMNYGGNPEAIKDGIEGILVPTGDAESLAKGIITLVENRQLREEMAHNARERFLSQFTSDKMVEKTASWLSDCIGKYGKKPASLT